VRSCVTVRVVNVFDSEMEEGPGRDGFWFRAAELGAMLGAARIGATVYEARAGVPIWPYHYHYPSEEWLYVLEGAPVLRDAGDRRALKAGDVVCFPVGHRGAHTLEGPGRFVLISGERSSGPFVSVYPDSDKVSVFPGVEADGLNALRLARAGSVDYWYGEGNGPVPPAPVTREPEGAPGQPILNARDVTCEPLEPTEGWRWASLGAAGGERLDGAVLELDPAVDYGPYHYEHGRELWLLVIVGTLTVVHAEGERALSPGDLACLPEGPAGGRWVLNRSSETARAVLLWTTGFPAAVCYPETGEWVLRTERGADEIRLQRA
jgi:uncharacterized cupin superfamily protein